VPAPVISAASSSSTIYSCVVKKVRQIDAEATGKVIVANPCVAKLLGLARQGPVSRAVFQSNGHDAVEHLGDLRRREMEVSVSAVPYRRNQSNLGELRQMGARGLRGNPSRVGKFGGGQSAAVEKRGEHRGSRSLSDQPGNFGDERTSNHVPNVAPDLHRISINHFDADRIGVDVEGMNINCTAIDTAAPAKQT
jgi:hypothetical protein